MNKIGEIIPIVIIFIILASCQSNKNTDLYYAPSPPYVYCDYKFSKYICFGENMESIGSYAVSLKSKKMGRNRLIFINNNINDNYDNKYDVIDRFIYFIDKTFLEINVTVEINSNKKIIIDKNYLIDRNNIIIGKSLYGYTIEYKIRI